MFSGKYTEGIGHGIWRAMVTMTTVGYGDKAPRVVAVIWMFFSIILVTSYTAAITASFTVAELEGRVRSPKDLPTAQQGFGQNHRFGRLGRIEKTLYGPNLLNSRKTWMHFRNSSIG